MIRITVCAKTIFHYHFAIKVYKQIVSEGFLSRSSHRLAIKIFLREIYFWHLFCHYILGKGETMSMLNWASANDMSFFLQFKEHILLFYCRPLLVQCFDLHMELIIRVYNQIIIKIIWMLFPSFNKILND